MSSNSLRLVFLSTLGPVDRFVLREVARENNVVAVLQPVWERPPSSPSRWRNLLRRPLGLPFGWLEQRLISAFAKKRWVEVAAQLGVDMTERASPAQQVEISTWSVNGERGVELLRSFNPDILLVSSGPLLKAPILSVPRIGSLNLHYGMAPWYRGEHTLYLPWVRGDVAHLGVTLHAIDAGVDTGAIVGRTALAVDDADTEASLWVKAGREFSEMVPAALTAIAQQGRIPGRPQEAIRGELVRYRERRWWWYLRDLLPRLPPPTSAVRREWNF